MERLNTLALGKLRPGVATPQFDRSRLRAGIAHIGVGAFHRAHQHHYLDDLAATEPSQRWGAVGINVVAPSLAKSLDPQDGLFTFIERHSQNGSSEATARVFGTLLETMDLSVVGGEAIIDRLCDPSIMIISTTITEKGYFHEPSSGHLLRDDPAIVSDAAGYLADSPPQTVHRLLLRAIMKRRELGIALPTLISCDNVPANGDLLGRMLAEFASLVMPSEVGWLEEHVRPPNTMVDRIVPATRPEDLAEATETLGVVDEAAVVGEPFRQWVMEDRFVSDRPAWESVGVEMVTDVGPYEDQKFRVVNATQSLLSYLGFLDGHEYMWQAIAVPEFDALAQRFLSDEIDPTLRTPTEGREEYRRTALTRLRNTAISHRTQQIATDGSRKIPQRFLAPLIERDEKGLQSPILTLAVAAWMRYVSGYDERSRRIHVDDPMALTLVAIGTRANGRVVDLVDGYLGLGEIFPRPLANNMAFRASVRQHLASLLTP